MSDMVERVARALMDIKARMPAEAYERFILSDDPDFDDLPTNANEGTIDDEITQEAVLRLARAAIEAMREPTDDMVSAADTDWGPQLRDNWRQMIDAALSKVYA